MNASSPRWALLLVLVAIPFVILAGFRLSPLEETGWGGAATILAPTLALVFALIWLLLLSRLPWRKRVIGLVGLIFAGIGLYYSVRLDGHMGDFIPQLAWRWSPKPGDEVGKLDLPQSADAGALNPPAAIGPDDFPAFLGPNRDNWISGSQLASNWAEQTPKQLWKREVGLGWSSFSVVGPFAYTLEQRNDEEMVVCYSVDSGDPIWAHSENDRFSESMGGDGPRSTPAIHQGKVYALTAKGLLLCLNAQDGTVLWRKDTLKDSGHSNLMWAKSCSPLVVNDLVVVTLGKSKDRSLAAYDLATGELRWRAGDDSASYATPTLATLAGREQIVVLNANSLSGHRPDTGAILWFWKLPDTAPAHNSNPLIVEDDKVLIGIGYGVGSWLLQIQTDTNDPNKQTVTEVWHNTYLKPKFTDLVLHNGYVYGLNETRLTCLNALTGERAWRGPRYGHGQILGVGDKLIIQKERGGITIVKASPEGHEVIHEFDALEGKTWNHPVLAGSRLLLRNDHEAIAYEFPGNGSRQ